MRLCWLAGMSAFALVTFPLTANAESTRTNQWLLEQCDLEIKNNEIGYCSAYIMGVGDVSSINGTGAVYSNDSSSFAGRYLFHTGLCTDGDEPDGGAMRQAFVDWARKHPEKSAGQAVGGVMAAMAATWPCKPRATN